MANLDFKEKMLGVVKIDDKKKIVVTHITIRQSIFFLHLRLITIEVIAAFAIILVHSILLGTDIKTNIGDNIISFNIPIFIILVMIKTFFAVFVIIQWLNEYYEITGHDVLHRKGLIFKREERTILEHIGSVDIEQGFFGRIFNFGTIKLFNWASEKEVYLYLIHNPLKYLHILEDLVPQTDREKKIFREHVLEPEDSSV